MAEHFSKEIDGVKMSIEIRGKKGLYTLRVWIPRHLRAEGEPGDRFFALKTRDQAEAHRLAEIAYKNLMEDLNRRVLGQQVDVSQNKYQKLLTMAAAEGFSYRSAASMMADGTMMNRIAHLMKADPNAQSLDLAQAVLGTAEAPKKKLSELVQWYIDENATELVRKTEHEMRKYRLPLERAVRYMTELVGDKAIEDLNEEDADLYEEYFKRRVVEYAMDKKEGKEKTNGILAATANKSIGHLRTMIKQYFRKNRIKRENPLAYVSITGGGEGERKVEFEPEYIRKHFLAPGSLPGMNQEERDLVIICALTGCRPSEICGIKPEHIILDVPHDESIYPGKVAVVELRYDGRELKNKSSIRDLVLIDEAYEAIKRHHNSAFQRYADNDNLSAAVNKYFREHGHDKAEKGKRTLYSLRHSFEGRMTEAKILNRVSARMMGHSVKQAIGREVYGDDLTVDQKLEVLVQIRP